MQSFIKKTGLLRVIGFLAVSFFCFLFFAISAQAAASPNGALVLSPTGTVYLIQNNQKLGFSSIEVFFSHGYNFGQISIANVEDLALPDGPLMIYADGILVKGLDQTVWIISNAQKRGFTSAHVFTGLGYSFGNLAQDSGNILSRIPQGVNIDSITVAHPAGTLVNDSGTVYQIAGSGKIGIPSVAVFESHGFRFERVVPANAADRALPQVGALSLRVNPQVQGALVTNNSSPSVSSLYCPVSLDANTYHNFFGYATDPDGDAITYIIDWGDGSIREIKTLGSGYGYSFRHYWVNPGSYLIQVEAQDNKGGASVNHCFIEVR